MMLTADKMAALYAYSEGRIGWRAACAVLGIVKQDELLGLLQDNDLPQPEYSYETDNALALNRLFRNAS
jgi:hypothetical protein